MKLEGKSVLVTGASGFLGGRLVERLLLEEGVHVRALVRNYTTAVWLSRTKVELVPGDITQPACLRLALAGCEVIFHCAAMLGGDPGQIYQVNVAGTANLLAAAWEAGVSRFVHISSLAVHGRDFPDGADETSPLEPGDDPYGQTKLASERLVLKYYEKYNLPAVILRPTIVYGPRSQWWTVDPIQRIKQNQLALLGSGDGIANVVYVDDVVNAILLAATVPGIEGEAFLISSDQRITWRDFFGNYAGMLRRDLPMWSVPKAQVITTMTDKIEQAIAITQDCNAYVEGARLGALVGLRGLRKLVYPLYKLWPREVDMYDQKAQVNIAKAERLLGYQPRWVLSKAMAETETWLRCQGYLSTDITNNKTQFK